MQNLLGPMRVPFLILAPACVLLGLGTAHWTTSQLNILHALLVLIGAVAAHVSVNSLNEYFDFKSGLDFKTQRTPFSGGSGTLPQKPGAAGQALATGLVSLGLAALVGIYFLYVQGLGLLPVGLLGLLVVVIYTPWLAHQSLLCLVAPGLGFGPLMVMGTHYALTGQYTWTAFIASLVPFFLVSNLLLLNQFPDVEADQSIGRQNLPIVAGRPASAWVYGSFLLLAYVSIVLGVYLRWLPALSLLGLGTLLIAVPAARDALRHAEDTAQLIPALGLNVIINIATPVLVAIGLFLG